MDAIAEFCSKFTKVAVCITTFDADNPIILGASIPHQTITGYSAMEIVGKTPRIFQGAYTCKGTSAMLKQCIRDDNFFHGAIINHRKDGSPYVLDLTVFPIRLGHHDYYCAIKSKVQEFDGNK